MQGFASEEKRLRKELDSVLLVDVVPILFQKNRGGVFDLLDTGIDTINETVQVALSL